MALLQIGVGNLLLALAVSAFLLPNGLMATGSTGFALALSQAAPLEVSTLVALINASAFAAGLLGLGRRFAMSTALSTVLYPLFLRLFQLWITGPLVQDTLLACISAAALSGLGVGLVIRSGASTGGMDIPALLLQKRAGIPVARTLCALDVLALLSQAVSAPAEQLIYGVLTAVLISIVVNKVVISGTGEVQVLIISPRYEDIGAGIRREVDRGMTLVEVETGYLREKQKAVLSVVTHRELPRLNRAALAVDPTAFIVVTSAYKVHGRGFSLER